MIASRRRFLSALCPLQTFSIFEPTSQAEKRHRADFGECLLFEEEPPFLPDTSPPLERSYRFFASAFW